MHAPRRSWFETTDPEQAHAVMAAAYSDDQRVGHAAGRVGIRWGFSSLRRFTTAYRAAYGGPPSDTVREHT